ncbi:hypothetical protein HDU85_001404 [Gaertneriomyces sp. JEL0708]|nr:hypothetical protein HDU85_001404 [Gaertneriomyces sp. JEL0708]
MMTTDESLSSCDAPASPPPDDGTADDAQPAIVSAKADFKMSDAMIVADVLSKLSGDCITTAGNLSAMVDTLRIVQDTLTRQGEQYDALKTQLSNERSCREAVEDELRRAQESHATLQSGLQEECMRSKTRLIEKEHAMLLLEDTHRTEMAGLRAQLQQKETTLSEKVNQLEKLQIEQRELTCRGEKFEAGLIELTGKCKELELMQSHNKALESSLHEADSKILSFRDCLEKSNQECSALRSELSHKDEQLREKDQEITRLSGDLKSQLNTYRDLRKAMKAAEIEQISVEAKMEAREVFLDQKDCAIDSLERENEQFAQDITRLMSAMTQSDEQRTKAQQRLELEVTRTKELKSQLEAVTTERDHALSMLTFTKSALEDTRKALEAAKMKEEQLGQEIEKQNASRDDILSKMADLHSSSHDLKERIDVAETQLELAKTRHAETEAQLAASTVRQAELLEENHRQKDTIESLRESLQKAIVHRDELLEAADRTISDRIETLTVELTKLEGELAISTSRTTELTNNLTEMEAKLKCTREALDDAEKDKAAASESARDQAQAQLSSLNKNLHRAEERIAELRAENEGKAIEIKRLETDVFQQSLQAQEEHVQLATQVDLLIAERDAKAQELLNLSEKLTLTEQEGVACRAKYIELEQQLKQREDDISGSAGQLEETQCALISSEARVAALSMDLERKSAEVESLERQSETLRLSMADESSELSAKINNITTERDDLLVQLQHHQRQIEESSTVLDQERQRSEELTAELDRKSQALRALELSFEELKASLETVDSKLTERTIECQSKAQELSSSHHELEALRPILIKTESERDAALERLRSAEGDLEQLNAQVEAKGHLITSLECERDALSVQYKESMGTVASLREQLSQAVANVADTEARLADLSRANEQLKVASKKLDEVQTAEEAKHQKKLQEISELLEQASAEKGALQEELKTKALLQEQFREKSLNDTALVKEKLESQRQIAEELHKELTDTRSLLEVVSSDKDRLLGEVEAKESLRQQLQETQELLRLAATENGELQSKLDANAEIQRQLQEVSQHLECATTERDRLQLELNSKSNIWNELQDVQQMLEKTTSENKELLTDLVAKAEALQPMEETKNALDKAVSEKEELQFTLNAKLSELDRIHTEHTEAIQTLQQESLRLRSLLQEQIAEKERHMAEVVRELELKTKESEEMVASRANLEAQVLELMKKIAEREEQAQSIQRVLEQQTCDLAERTQVICGLERQIAELTAEYEKMTSQQNLPLSQLREKDLPVSEVAGIKDAGGFVDPTSARRESEFLGPTPSVVGFSSPQRTFVHPVGIPPESQLLSQGSGQDRISPSKRHTSAGSVSTPLKKRRLTESSVGNIVSRGSCDTPSTAQLLAKPSPSATAVGRKIEKFIALSGFRDGVDPAFSIRMKIKIEEIIDHFDDAVVLRGNDVWDPRTTHVISPSSGRTMKTFGAALSSRWIITDPQWVIKSYEERQWIPEDNYGFRNRNEKPFVNKRFFITPTFPRDHRGQMKYMDALIIGCGSGLIVERIEEADYVLKGVNDKESYPKHCLDWNQFAKMIPQPPK